MNIANLLTCRREGRSLIYVVAFYLVDELIGYEAYDLSNQTLLKTA